MAAPIQVMTPEDGPWLVDRCRRSSPLALRPHRGANVLPLFTHVSSGSSLSRFTSTILVRPTRDRQIRNTTAFAFVVQLKAGVPDQVDDRLCVEYRQL